MRWRNGEYQYSFGEFMEDNPAVAYVVIGLVGFFIFCLLIGSYVGGQRSDAEAQCESIGGTYGSNHCYVDSEDYHLKIDRGN